MHKEYRQSSEPIKTWRKYMYSSRRKGQENVCKQVMIGFGFTSDWVNTWHKIFFLSYCVG